MRWSVLGLVAISAALSARAADLELRPPQSRSEIELGPRERPARLRVYWSCFGSDLGAAARDWLHARPARPDCATAAPLLAVDSGALASALATAAHGHVLGDPEKGEVQELDAEPGRTRQLTEDFCYSGEDVAQIIAWTRRQLAALCETGAR
jgi:hypothetical protein